MLKGLGGVFSSPIGRKGIALVAIPLVFSMLFIFCLRYLLNEASVAAERESRSKEAIGLANRFGAEMIQVGAAYYIARTMGNRDTFVPKLERLREDFDLLERLTGTNKTRKKLLTKTRANLEELFDVLSKRWEKKLDRPRRPRSLIDNLENLEVRDKIQDLLNSILRDMNAVVYDEKNEQKRIPITSKKYKSLIDGFLLAGVSADIILAFILIAYFASGITKRLAVLSDNSRRLAEEKELNPKLSGSDEIAALDTSFREMADKLSQARQRERSMLESLKLSETRLRSMLDTIPLGLLVLDTENKIVFLSPSAEGLLAYKKDELEGHEFSELFGQSGGRATQSLIPALSSLDARVPKELQVRRKDGSSFPAELLGTDFHTEESNGRLLILTDISAKYEIEKMKQGFISMVSHELRSPLMSVQTCLKMLAKGHFGSMSEDGQQSVQMAEKSIVRLISLVNEILDAERLESGTISVDRKECSVAEIFELALASVRGLAEASSIELEDDCRIAPAEKVYADPDRIVQVIVNLVSNAIKFSDKNSKVILSAMPKESCVEISVVDRGRGIPEEHLNLIFQRFHQVKKSDAGEKGGTGLGLAICKAIIEAHQGEIAVESSPGKGSRFYFSLPYAGDSDE